MVSWVVGVTKDPKIPFDINEIMKKNPTYQSGDIATKYDKDKKATIPGKCLIEDLNNLIPATNQELSVGNVVKHKLTDKEMTITWIIGQTNESSSLLDFNRMSKMQGFEDGDIVCGFFDKKEYKTEIIKKGEVEKIFE
jgi:hypothetical protein